MCLHTYERELKNRISVHKEYGRIPHVLCMPNLINQLFMNILQKHKGEITCQSEEGKGTEFVIKLPIKGE